MAEPMIGNLFIQVIDTVKDVYEFGKGLENYFKTEEEFIKALQEAFYNTNGIITGKLNVKVQQQEVKDTFSFYAMPCELYDQNSKPFSPNNLAKALMECGRDERHPKPFMLIFKFDERKKESFDFNSEIRAWYKEHYELRKELPSDKDALFHEPKRLLLLKFHDNAYNQDYSFVLTDSIMYQKVHTSIYALIIFKAEYRKF